MQTTSWNLKRISFGFALILMDPSCGLSSTINQEIQPTFFLNANARGCAIEVRLNDIPVLRINAADSSSPPRAAATAEDYVVNGVNELRLIVLKAYERSGSPDARAWISSSGPDGLTVESPQAGDASVVMLAEWMPGTENAPLPKTIEARKDLGQTLGERLWEKAPRLTLDNNTREKTGAFLASIRKALMRGDGNAMVTYELPEIREMSRFGLSVNDLEKFTREAAKGWIKQHGKLAPLDPAEWDFHLVAGGRLIECINKDGRPTLRTALADPLGLSGLRVFIGLDHGQMRVFLLG